MKTRFTLILLFTICVQFCFAQNWSPIPHGKKSHYFQQDPSNTSLGGIPRHKVSTIWVDSITSNSDSIIISLNHKAKTSNEDYNLEINISGEFGKNIIETDSAFIFGDSIKYTLNKSSLVGKTWIFQLEDSINAKLLSTEVDSVFEVVDSIKIIQLSTGGQIHWSKNYGVIKLQFSSEEDVLELVGIQEEFGLQIPMFEDFFTFKIGDTLVYSFKPCMRIEQSWDCGYFIRKVWINEVHITDTSRIYIGEMITRNMDHGTFFTGSYQIGHVEESLSSTFTDFPQNSTIGILTLRSFNEDVFSVSENQYSYYLHFTSDLIDNKLVKRGLGFFGVTDPMAPPSSIFTKINLHSELVYQEDLGKTVDCYSNSNEGRCTRLIGYHLGDEWVGTHYSNKWMTMILDDVEKIEEAQLKAKIHPNPARNELFYTIENQTSFVDFSLTIYNLLGDKLITKSELSSNGSIHLGDMKNGIYIVEIIANGNQIHLEKLIIE